MIDEFGDLPLVNDGKAPDALRTIGEVCRALGLKPHVLRYWEGQFPTLSPIKRSGGRRYYRPDDVRLIAAIDRLVHKQGYTLRGARLALDKKAQPAASGGPASDTLRAGLRRIRDDLARALAVS